MKLKFKTIVLLLLVLILIFVREIGRQAYLLGIRWLYLLLLSFSVSFLLTPLTIVIANRFNILDYPSERKLHLVPTPRIGGLAVFLAIMITLLRNVQFAKEISGLLIAVTIIFFSSLLDDIYNLPAVLRLVLQIVASFIIIAFGFRITALPRGFPLENFFETLLTIFWIVGITNAVAFLDGIDGLISGFGTLCSVMFLVIALTTGQKYISFLCAAVIGSCLGFIPYNWYKAKTFLGECGASVIGFMLASISVIGWWAEKNPIVSLSVPVLVLSVPIYDMIYITFSRIKNGTVRSIKEWLEYTGKDHIHHRLLKLGFTVPQAVSFILLITFTSGFYSLLLKYLNITDLTAVFVLIQASLIFVLLSFLMYVGKEKT